MFTGAVTSFISELELFDCLHCGGATVFAVKSLSRVVVMFSQKIMETAGELSELPHEVFLKASVPHFIRMPSMEPVPRVQRTTAL
jgi:hypothetical protein